MPVKLVRAPFVILSAMVLSACKIQIEVPSGGAVVSSSGEYRCEAGQTCSIDVVDFLFDETFEVIPDAGYTFTGWVRRERGLCGGSSEACHLMTAAFEGNSALMAILDSNDIFFLEPGIEKQTTSGVLCDYNDSTANSQESLTYTSTSRWSCTETARELVANGIPDHPVGAFPNPGNPNTISEQTVSVSYTLEPLASGTATGLGGPLGAAGYVLNGVKIDADTAGSCDDSGNACSLIGNTGNWSIEALGQSVFDFGTDENNAHVQPGGIYHYHGMPEGFIAKRASGSEAMVLIGWAADGFPIYARYGYSVPGNADSELKVMRGSYQLHEEISSSRPPADIYPLGTFRQDWAYVEGSGDLDECNGRYGVTPEFPDGIYHYYATDSYPYFQRCVTGEVETQGGGRPPPR